MPGQGSFATRWEHFAVHTEAYRIASTLTLEVLVLPLQGLQLIKSLLIGVLHLEQLSAESEALSGHPPIYLTLLILPFPICQDLLRTVCVVRRICMQPLPIFHINDVLEVLCSVNVAIESRVECPNHG